MVIVIVIIRTTVMIIMITITVMQRRQEGACPGGEGKSRWRGASFVVGVEIAQTGGGSEVIGAGVNSLWADLKPVVGVCVGKFG